MNGIQNNLAKLYEQIGITQATNPLNPTAQRENPDTYLAKIQECEALISSIQAQLNSPAMKGLQQSNPSQFTALSQKLGEQIQQLSQLSKSNQDKLSSSLGDFASISSQYTTNRLSLTNALNQAQNGMPLGVSEAYLNAINNRPINDNLANILATV